MYPMSVAASPDGGFTVVGYGNFGTDANDAFAQHFVYKPISAVFHTVIRCLRQAPHLTLVLSGRVLLFRI